MKKHKPSWLQHRNINMSPCNGQFWKIDAPFQSSHKPTDLHNGPINQEWSGNRRMGPDLYFIHHPHFNPFWLCQTYWSLFEHPPCKDSVITMICPDKVTRSSPLQQPFHILRLPHICSATSRYFHFPHTMRTIQWLYMYPVIKWIWTQLMSLPQIFTFGNTLVATGPQVTYRNWQTYLISQLHNSISTDWLDWIYFTSWNQQGHRRTLSYMKALSTPRDCQEQFLQPDHWPQNQDPGNTIRMNNWL